MSESERPYCQIKMIYRKVQILEDQLKKEHGIGLDEAIILCCLSEECKCQGNLANETGLTATQASRSLSSLETQELIKRTIDKTDKRKMIFTLTNKGKEKIKSITPMGIAFFVQ
ncbi:MAG: winged helix DNA-binding protein [Bacteroidales bacterium]|nr:winged helix DNA-binding protein [Bacteroidales bacterium]